MGYLILLSKQNYAVLLHILEDISGQPKSEWPDKYTDFECVTRGFTNNVESGKPSVAYIVPTNLITGFLNTVGGYKKASMTAIELNECPDMEKHLTHSVGLLNGLILEINSHLAEYDFSVN